MAAAHVSFHLCYFSQDIFSSLPRNKDPGHIMSVCGRQLCCGCCIGFRSSAKCPVSTIGASVGPPQVPLLTHRTAKSLQYFPDVCQVWSARTSSGWEDSEGQLHTTVLIDAFFPPKIQPCPRWTRHRPPAIQTVRSLYQFIFFQTLLIWDVFQLVTSTGKVPDPMLSILGVPRLINKYLHFRVLSVYFGRFTSPP